MDELAEQRTPLTYNAYLQLPQLLDCLQPKTEFPTERLFIVVHQVYELWFRQVLDDIDAVRDILKESPTENQLPTIIKRLQRVLMIFKLIVQHFAILETMTPMEFMDFRGVLYPASGFQSLQFRLIEIKLGVKEEHRIQYNQRPYTAALEDEGRQKIRETVKEPSLVDLLERWLENTPGLNHRDFDFVAQFREKVQAWKAETNDNDMSDFDKVLVEQEYNKGLERGDRRLSQKAFLGALMTCLYRQHPAFSNRHTILSLLMDIETAVINWRSNHVMMVHRMIGSKSGTGGSSGVPYLRSTVGAERYRVFRDLFNLSTVLVPSAFVPPLPNLEAP